MGRLIDIDKAREEYRNLMDLTMSDTTLLHTLYGVLDNAPTVEAIPKADYKARLKADMVAMLTDIQLEIEEIVSEEELIDKKWATGLHYASNIIQQKINLLKESD